MQEEEIVTSPATKGLVAVTSTFVLQSIEHMIPWLMIMAVVILCDLASGIHRSMKKREEIRMSRAFRETMGKMVTYFSFVMMVCMINIATHNKYSFDIYSCLFVCMVELGSILSNILEPKGITLNLINLIELIFGKLTGWKKEDMDKVFGEKEREEKGERKEDEGRQSRR